MSSTTNTKHSRKSKQSVHFRLWNSVALLLLVSNFLLYTMASNPAAEKAGPVIFSSSTVKPSPSAVVPSSSLAEKKTYFHYYGPGVIPTQTASTALFLPESSTSSSSDSSTMPSSIHSNTRPYSPRLEPDQLASGSARADAYIPPKPSDVSPAGSASLTTSIGRNSDKTDTDISISSKDSKRSNNSQDRLPSSTSSSFYGELISRSLQTVNPTNPNASDQATLLAEDYWNDITDGRTTEQMFSHDEWSSQPNFEPGF